MQGSRLGSMVLVWTGDRIMALDTSERGATVKWEKKTWKDATSWQMQFGINQFGIRILQNMAKPLPDAERIPLHVTADVTCYQRGSELVALSSRTGEIAWIRRDLPLGCDLFGDHELLFVTAPDSRECQVVRLRDGEEVGQRQVPPVNQRMATRGRLVLTWKSDKEGSGWQLLDAWEQKEIWSKQFPAGTLPWMVNSRELAAVAADGTLTIMAGGAAEAYQRALPSFDAMGTTVRHIGPTGTGTVVKLVNQLLVGIHSVAAAEAMVVGAKAGADPALVFEVVNSGWGHSFMLDRNAPVMLDRDFDGVRTQIKVFLKDMGRSEERRGGKECRSRWAPDH